MAVTLSENTKSAILQEMREIAAAKGSLSYSGTPGFLLSRFDINWREYVENPWQSSFKKWLHAHFELLMIDDYHYVPVSATSTTEPALPKETTIMCKETLLRTMDENTGV